MSLVARNASRRSHSFSTLATHYDLLYSIRRDNDDKKKESRQRRGIPVVQLHSWQPYSVVQPHYRSFHTSVPNDRAAAIILGLGAVSATAYAASSAVKAYNEYKASLPTEEEWQQQQREREQQEKEQQQHQQQASSQEGKAKQQETSKKQEGPRENLFAKWFGVGVGTKYYEGGFEETMTRKEAALILGVRESSSPARIKEAHRKLLILNHPDTGGSTYIAGKINEAKELLLKGKRGGI